MLTSLTPRSQFTDSSVIVIRGEPRREALRGAPRPARMAALPPPSPPSKYRSRGFAGLSMATVALLLALIWALWVGRKAWAEAESARSSAELSWAFADGVLEDLKSLRADASRLDADRKDVIRTLADTQQQRHALKTQVYEWQTQTQTLEAQSKRALTQWASYGQQLEQTLGSARTQLNETSTVLQQERTTAQQQLADLGQEKDQLGQEKDRLARDKENVEREAASLDRLAQSLNNNNQQLQGEVNSLNSEMTRLRNCLSSLESEKASLLSCNASLSSENRSLKCEVGDLQSRIRCLEGELSRAKDDSGRGKR